MEIHKIVIRDRDGQVQEELFPKVVESCMSPGSYLVTPVDILETETQVLFYIEGKETELLKKDIEAGLVSYEEVICTYEPVQTKGSCIPCRNCGGCSW